MLTAPRPPCPNPDTHALGLRPVAAADSPLLSERAAHRSVPSHIRLWGVALAGLAADLLSKDWAFHTLRQGGHRVLVPYALEFHTTLNPGALFGIGRGHTEVFLIASVLALILVLWMFAQTPARKWLTHVALGAILAGALGNMYDRVVVQLIMYGSATPSGPVARYYVVDAAADGDWLTLQEYPPTPDATPRKLPRKLVDDLPRPVGYVRDFIKIPTTLPQWAWIPSKWQGRELWPWVFNVADMLLVVGVGVLSIKMLRERRPAARPAISLDGPNQTA